MSTDQIWQTASPDAAATESLGEKIGRNCKGGEIFELVGDLGAGKTTFVRGLARGLDSLDDVSSPSFTINNVYRTNSRLMLQHFDFYRLAEAGIVADELNEVIHDPINVVAVEWGDIVHDVLPTNRLIVEFKNGSDEERLISIRFTGSTKHALKDLLK